MGKRVGIQRKGKVINLKLDAHVQNGYPNKSPGAQTGSNRFLSRYYGKAKHGQTCMVSTWAINSIKALFIAFSIVRSLHPPSLMSLVQERYRVFETRAPDEEEWSTLEELFNAHGYNFRPRLRKGWTPSWHTTGKSPLHSEDGEILRVP